MKIDKFENFDPMIGIDNALNNKTFLVLCVALLLKNGISLKDLGHNLKTNFFYFKNLFIDYCRSLGYQIDKDYSDSNFQGLIDDIKKILKRID